MAGGSRDVGELWAQLKSQQAPARRSGPTLSGLAGLPGITSTVRTYDKSRGPRQERPSFIAQLGQGGDRNGQQHQQGAASDHQALQATLQRDINGLSDPDRSTRRRSLEKLHAALLGPGATVAPDALQALLEGPLLVPVVRLLADPAEKCRELAAALLAAALPCLPAPHALLPTLLPALAERVGSMPPQEGSEEIRLALAELLAGPLLGTLAAQARAAPGASPVPPGLLPPLCAALCCQLADPYADIKKAACTSVTHLAALAGSGPDAMPAALLEPLVASLAADLAHQHSRVRLAALHALHAVVQRGMPVALMQDLVLPAARPLAHDHAPAVRAALFGSAARWAGSQLGAAGDKDGRATNQCATFLPLLLPLVLVGLTDEAEAVRSDTYAQLDAIAGRLARQPACGHKDAALPASQPLPGYCHPFCGARPSAATRWLVQAQLTRLLQQSLAELREWTATLRAAAARLLRASLVYGEDEVLPLLPSVLLALQGAVADDDAGVAAHAVGCVHVLGANLAPRQWMPLACEAVAAERHSVAQRTAALVVLSGLLYSASMCRAAVDGKALQLGAATLGSPALVATAAAPDGAPLRQQLLAACSNLVRWAGPGAATVAPQLFQLLLQLWVVEAEASSQGSAAEPVGAASGGAADASGTGGALTAAAVLAQLATALGRASAAGLCDAYGAEMMQRCVQRHEQWTHAHPDWRTASALLRVAGAASLLRLWPVALPALRQLAADHEREPLLRLELLQLMAALAEDDSKAEAWPQAGAGQALLAGVLSPALVWRAGRVPAAARYAALAALSAMLAGRRLPAGQVAAAVLADGDAAGLPAAAAGPAGAGEGRGGKAGSLLSRVAGCLDEEYEPDTRQLACHAMALLLEVAGSELPAAELAALQPALLARLDDSSNRVRVSACAALRAWLACQLAPAGAVASLADADVAALASSALIHLDDPDAEVAHAVADVLCTLAAAQPGVVRPLARAAAAAQQLRSDLFGRVLAACDGSAAISSA